MDDDPVSQPAIARALVRTARAVAAAEEPKDGLRAVLAAFRECVGASGAAILQAESGRLVPIATDGMAPAERPLDEAALAPDESGGYPLILSGRVEGVLVLAGVSQVTVADAEATLMPLLDLAGVALRNARLSTEQQRDREALERRAAELARSNYDLEQFAYAASQDLQEPLRTISSYLQLLERRYKGKLDQDADEFIGYAVEAAKHMQRLIQDLLAYARAVQADPPRRRVDCNVIVDRVISQLRVAIEESNGIVTHGPLPTIPGDPAQLGQLFQNLIANGLKFRATNPPLVQVTAEQRAEDPDMWTFAVRDNGIGIEPQYRERVFGIFRRLHGREQYPGSGIGLALCSQIVERHGGRIWIESAPDKGTIFFFTLPSASQPPV